MPSVLLAKFLGLTQILAHALDIIEYSSPLRRRVRLCSTVTGHGYRELHSWVPRIVVNDVQLSFGIGVVEASFQSVEEVLVEEFQLNRNGDSLTQSRTF